MKQTTKPENQEDIRSHLDCVVKPHFKVSVYDDFYWSEIETDIPQFEIRDLIRILKSYGYENDSILVEAV